MLEGETVFAVLMPFINFKASYFVEDLSTSSGSVTSSIPLAFLEKNVYNWADAMIGPINWT